MDVLRHKAVIEELLRGKAYAAKLQDLVQADAKNTICSQNLTLLDEMIEKILSSFTQAHSALSSSAVTSGETQSDVSKDSPSNEVGAYSAPDSRSCAESNTVRKAKERRGCYKRKNSSETWTLFSSHLEDGRTWRKYGQKDIINSRHPRSYFRCSRRYGQGCKATKQVQRMEENSKMYRIIYIGQHTCKDVGYSSLISGTDPWRSYQSPVNSVSVLKEEPTDTTQPLLELDASHEDFWKCLTPPVLSSSSDTLYHGCAVEPLEMDSMPNIDDWL